MAAGAAAGAGVAAGNGRVLQASPWIRRFTELVPAGSTVLDVACGAGRHMQWFAAQGYPVLGVDRNAEALATACQYGEVLQADLEDGSPWPLPGRQFGAVVVTNYLWRAVFPSLFDSVQPGGVLLYETFAVGNETVGRPSNPEFLLQPGELLQRVAAAGPQWRVIAYEDGFEADPERFVQRIAAVRTVTTDADAEAPTRYPLQSGLL